MSIKRKTDRLRLSPLAPEVASDRLPPFRNISGEGSPNTESLPRDAGAANNDAPAQNRAARRRSMTVPRQEAWSVISPTLASPDVLGDLVSAYPTPQLGGDQADPGVTGKNVNGIGVVEAMLTSAFASVLNVSGRSSSFTEPLQRPSKQDYRSSGPAHVDHPGASVNYLIAPEDEPLVAGHAARLRRNQGRDPMVTAQRAVGMPAAGGAYVGGPLSARPEAPGPVVYRDGTVPAAARRSVKPISGPMKYERRRASDHG